MPVTPPLPGGVLTLSEFHKASLPFCPNTTWKGFRSEKGNCVGVVADGRKFEFHIDSMPEKFLAFMDVLQLSYPIKLAAGEQYELKLEIDPVNQAMAEYRATKMQMVTIDTMGKHHKSKWHDLRFRA